jgi:hypothetical protein
MMMTDDQILDAAFDAAVGPGWDKTPSIDPPSWRCLPEVATNHRKIMALALRRETDLSQSEVAIMLGTSQGQVSRWETGK